MTASTAEGIFVAGRWRIGDRRFEVRSPYSGNVIATVTSADTDDVEDALSAAVEGAQEMSRVPAYRRAEILHRAAELAQSRVADLALTISNEEGKPLSEALREATLVPPLLHLCAEEALRITGEVLPMDASDRGIGRLGFTLVEPSGVVLAITPFNFPARLVLFKVGPALAAGNAVVLKPASATPLTAIFLVKILLEAGLPPSAIQCVIGPGGTVGAQLCADRRVRCVSFTGSRAVAEQIATAAGVKRTSFELGSNVAVVLLDDCDIEQAARSIGRDGFLNAGQSCTSAQRVIAQRSVVADFTERLLERVDAIRTGDPRDSRTTLGPVISASEAERIVSWIREAEVHGAKVLRGGDRSAAFVSPTVLAEVPPDSRVWREELFGPAVAIRQVETDEAALDAANDTRYGLAACVFTRDIDRAVRFARGVRSGVVHINSGPLFRLDFMPYGGYGDSGFGKEGVKYSIGEMTETKLVVVHPGATS